MSGKSVFPTFMTQRLILRPIEITDAPAYERQFNDYEVISHFSSAVPWPYPKDGVQRYLVDVILPEQGTTRWTWGIFLKEQPEEFIGCIDLWRDGDPEHRAFWLGKKYWGLGFMTEAVKPVTDYAFTSLGFDTLIFANAVGNLRSRRVKEKTGAKLIAIEPAKFVNPIYREQEVWELTKEAWQKFRQK